MIYFARPDQSAAVKIGFTAGDVTERLAALQTGQPTRLRLLGLAGGYEDRERQLHERFKADRLMGEWFRMSPPLAWLIAATDPDFLLLTAREPRLIDVALRCGGVEHHAGYCRLRAWYGDVGFDGETLHTRLGGLVGMGREAADAPDWARWPRPLPGAPPARITAAELVRDDRYERFLRTLPLPRIREERRLSEAEPYDLAYRVLNELLPECAGGPCGCERE